MTVAAMRYVLSRIAEALGCSPDEDEDLVEVVRRLVAERDEARAEVERLRGERDEQIAEAARERDEALSQVKAWQAEELARRTERDEARAEIERLRGDAGLNHWLRRLMRERDEARAEVELLKDHAAGTLCIRCDLLQVERDAARAEVERLRALLDGYSTGDE